jgi:hypothetical protein
MKTSEVVQLLVNALENTMVELEKQDIWCGEVLDNDIQGVLMVGRAIVAAAKELEMEERIYTIPELKELVREFLAERDNAAKSAWVDTDRNFGRRELDRFFLQLERKEK